MIYIIRVPDDLSGYETEPGDLLQAILGTIETWLGPDYTAFKVDGPIRTEARMDRVFYKYMP